MRKCLVYFVVVLFCSQDACGQYDVKDSLVEGLSAVLNGKRYGFVDANDRVVIPIEYELVDRFQEGLAKVQKNGKFGFIDKRNKVVIPFTLTAASSFVNGSAMVYNEKLFWLIDKQGNQITPRKYTVLNFYNNEHCIIVILDKKYGCINRQGQEIIAPEYDELEEYAEGMLAARKGYNWGFIDTADNIKLPFIYTSASSFSNGAAIVSKVFKYGTIDKTGKPIISFEYDDLVADDATGWYKAQKKGRYGMVDRNGKEKIGYKFDDIGPFSTINAGFASMKIKELHGVINNKGEIVVPAQYDKIVFFADNVCGIIKGEKVGLASFQTGKEVAPTKYDEISRFDNGLAWANINAMVTGTPVTYYGLINEQGQELTPIKYEGATEMNEGMAGVKLDDKWGFVDSTGKEVIFPRYDDAGSFENGKALVVQGKDTFFIDKKGRLSARPALAKTVLAPAATPETKTPANKLASNLEDLPIAIPTAAEMFKASVEKHYLVYVKKEVPDTQLVISDTAFTYSQITEKAQQGYAITDYVNDGANHNSVTITMTKNLKNAFNYKVFPELSDLTHLLGRLATNKSTMKITRLTYAHKQWVIAFNGLNTMSEQELVTSTVGSGDNYPAAEVQAYIDKGYFITDMAHGADGWAVVVSKDANYLLQKLLIYDHFYTTELEQQKREGYVLTSMTQAKAKWYAVFSKLADMKDFYYQPYTTKPDPGADKLLKQGFNIYRIFDVGKMSK